MVAPSRITVAHSRASRVAHALPPPLGGRSVSVSEPGGAPNTSGTGRSASPLALTHTMLAMTYSTVALTYSILACRNSLLALTHTMLATTYSTLALTFSRLSFGKRRAARLESLPCSLKRREAGACLSGWKPSVLSFHKALFALTMGALTLMLAACGGGGNGGGGTVVGRVLQVETGGPPNPQASVQTSSASALTSTADGSFQVGAPDGSTSLTVDTLTQSSGVWVFSIVSVSGVTDVGDLWVGPERVSVHGTVRDSTNNNPVPGAPVSFAGRNAVTAAN